MASPDVYREWYKIMFFEEYYQLLAADYVKNDNLITWLSQFDNPLHFLYEEWLSCDGAFNGDWDEMIDWMEEVLSEEEK